MSFSTIQLQKMRRGTNLLYGVLLADAILSADQTSEVFLNALQDYFHYFFYDRN